MCLSGGMLILVFTSKDAYYAFSIQEYKLYDTHISFDTAGPHQMIVLQFLWYS